MVVGLRCGATMPLFCSWRATTAARGTYPQEKNKERKSYALAREFREEKVHR